MRKKALLIPYSKETGRIFLQDRRTYRKPDWGFFGGGIKEGESVIEALIRETKEELDIVITEADIIFLEINVADYSNIQAERNFFLYPTTEVAFTVYEGEGVWVNFEQAKDFLDKGERFDHIVELIHKASKK